MSDPRSAGAVDISITSLDSPRVIRTLRSDLTKAIEDQSAQNATGNAKDWGDYQRRVGRVEGMMAALDIVKSIEDENSK